MTVHYLEYILHFFYILQYFIFYIYIVFHVLLCLYTVSACVCKLHTFVCVCLHNRLYCQWSATRALLWAFQWPENTVQVVQLTNKQTRLGRSWKPYPLCSGSHLFRFIWLYVLLSTLGMWENLTPCVMTWTLDHSWPGSGPEPFHPWHMSVKLARVDSRPRVQRDGLGALMTGREIGPNS